MSAGKNAREEILTLTRTMLRNFFIKNQTEPYLSLLADDVLWLGGCDYMQAEGKAEVLPFYEKGMKEMRPCRMSQEHYSVKELAPGIWLGQGVSWVETNPEDSILLSCSQRCSFIFRHTEKAKAEDWHWEIVYVHQSIGYAETQQEEFFALKKGYQNFRKIKSYDSGVVPTAARETLYQDLRRRFNALPDSFQEALTMLAVFDSFTLPQALYCCGELLSDSMAFKQECDSMPFLIFSYDKNTYKFHPLLLKFLQNRLEDFPPQKREDCLRQAVCWYLKNKEPEKAFTEAWKIKEWGLLLDAVEQGKLKLLYHYKVDKMIDLIPQLPPQYRTSHLESCMLLMLYILLCLDPREANEMWDTFMTDLPVTFEESPAIRMAFWMLKGISTAPDLEAMLPCFRKAREISRYTTVKLPRDYFLGVTRGADSQLAFYSHEKGQLRDTREMLKTIYEYCGSVVQDVDVLGWQNLVDGEYAYLTGNIEAAGLFLENALNSELSDTDEQERACVAYSLLPRIYLIQGRKDAFKASFVLYKKLQKKVQNPLWKAALTIIAANTGSLVMKLDKRAEDVMRELIALPHYPSQNSMRRLARHRLLLARHRYTALTYADALIGTGPDRRQGVSNLDSIYEELILAVAQGQRGEKEMARKLIDSAFENAWGDHVIMPFAEYREELLPYLSEVRQENEYREFIRKIETVGFEKATVEDAGSGSLQSEIALTPREKTIVQCLEKGMTNKAIARQLMLAEVTVKKSESRIYKKYGVHNRSALLVKLQGRTNPDKENSPL